MDVLLPEGKQLNPFEKKLQRTLQQANLPGYALMNFTYVEASTLQTHEIDALLILKDGVFVVLEAKGYGGKWTGSVSGTWLSNNNRIKAVGGNPYEQAKQYMYVIKNKLEANLFKDIRVWVNFLVVAPDKADLQINDAVIDEFTQGAILICHLSKIENFISKIRERSPIRPQVKNKVDELNDLLEIASDLTTMSVEELKQLITKPENGEQETDNEEDDESENGGQETGGEEDDESGNGGQETGGEEDDKKPRRRVKVVLGIAAVGILGLFGWGLTYFWNNRSCDNPEEIRVEGKCYKDISKTGLKIGILTPPEDYLLLRDYLQQELGSEVADVVIEGGADSSYQDAQNNIALKKWDVVFALSPMNGMRAKDNGYQWVARMFPDYTPTYQVALFVRQDSPIQSINDITSNTKIALGDSNSASSFYIPSYNLYGKSITVMKDNESSEIIELVASGEADIGSVVHGRVQDDRRFRVLDVSQEVPGGGVYLSPKLPPTVSDKIAQILMNAPPEIKDQEEANYGAGDEPNYEVLRLISLRVDEILSCADFSQNPVQFFCLETPEGIIGTIRGFTREDNESVRFRFEQENGETCALVTSLKTLSSVPDGTSPGVLNRKRVSVIGVEPQQVDGSCEMIILNPSQLKVLSDDE